MIWTTRLPKDRTNLHPLSQRLTDSSWTSMRQGSSSAWECPTVDERTNNFKVHTMESRGLSVVRREEPLPPLSNKEVSSQMGRTIWNLPSHFPACLSSPSTSNLEDPWCLPCLPPINLSRDCQTQTKLHKSTPWGDRGQRRIWSHWNSLTQEIPWPQIVSGVLERVFVHGKHLGAWVKPQTCTNNPNVVQTTEWSIRAAWCEHDVLKLPSLTTSTHAMSLSSNSSPSHPGRLDSQWFHWIFPCALPHQQCNILYATVLQQPCLVTKLEWQSAYEENDSLQSLIHVFHHLCSTQIYLGSLEPHTDHIVSSTLHIVSALKDVLDLLHNNGFHRHILALLPNNITLTCMFHPIYHTMTAVEQDTYEELDLRLVHCILSSLPLSVPTPCVLSSKPQHCPHYPLPPPLLTSPLTPVLCFTRAIPPPTLHELYLKTPVWAHP